MWDPLLLKYDIISICHFFSWWELENYSESVWVKVWQVGTGNLVVLVNTFNCSEISLTISGTNLKVKKKRLPSVHVLGDFNFRDIDWPHRLNKSDSALSQSEGQMLADIMNDHGLEQLVHFPTRDKKYIGFITHFSSWSVSGYSLTGQTQRSWYCCWNFESCHSPHKETSEKGVFISGRWLWKMHLNLQRKSISTVFQILVRYKRTLTWLLLLFKIRRINTSHPKLVGRSLRFPRLPRK